MQLHTEVTMTLKQQTQHMLMGSSLYVFYKGLFQSPNLWLVKRYSHPLQPVHPSPLPSACHLSGLVVMATTWDASCRQQWFSGFADFLSLPWITTQTLWPGNESIWQRVKYGHRFVCCDIWWQRSSPRYTALAALYFSTQKWWCLFNTWWR